MTESWRNILVDRIGLHLNAYTWYRYRLIQPFLIPGRIRVLNRPRARRPSGGEVPRDPDVLARVAKDVTHG